MKHPNIGHFFQTHEFYLSVIIIALTSVIGLINPAFFSTSNIFDLLKSCVVMGVFALAVLIVLISGGIDISFTAIAAVCMYGTSKILIGLDFTSSVIVGFGLSCLIGLTLGLFNAAFITWFKLPTLIVTLGTASIFRGFLLAFVGTITITNLPDSLIRFSKLMVFRTTLQSGEITGLSASIFILLLLALVVAGLLQYTLLGRGIYAMGGDPIAAERVGFDLNKLQFFIYGFVGALSGIAGLIHSAMMRNANPFDLVGTELVVIAAVVLGGASITGGRGTVIGTMLGVLLIVILNNSLILLGIPSYWQRVFIGLIIVISTAITAQKKLQSRGRIAFG